MPGTMNPNITFIRIGPNTKMSILTSWFETPPIIIKKESRVLLWEWSFQPPISRREVYLA